MNSTVLVDVYWNLNKKLWSIRDAKSGLVVVHAKSVFLTNPVFRVGSAGRDRVRREGRKNVHAFVRGRLDPDNILGDTSDRKGLSKAHYNPYLTQEFVSLWNGRLIESNEVPGVGVAVLNSDASVDLYE